MADQAQNLREFVRESRNGAHVIAVTSGKGGVGKTSTTVNLAIALSEAGKRVIVLDADLGLANVEVLLGLNSFYNLQHVINGERSMEQILVRGPGGIELIPGSSGLAKLADLGDRARQRVLDGLASLQEKADFILIDTMAGIGQNVVSFAVAADEVIVVCTPEPSSIVDAYAMIKTVHQMRPGAKIRLLVNQALNPQQAEAVAAKLARVCQQYLSMKLSRVGEIPRDPHVSQGVMQTTPFVLRFPTAPATRAVQDIAGRLLYQRADESHARTGFFKRFASSLGLKKTESA